ncbi:hypothetical protein D9M71_367890 [compost metagenome]
MEVPGEFFTGYILCYHFEHFPRRASGAGADGVPQRDLVAAHGIELASDQSDLLRGNVTFIGAAQHAGHVPAHGHSLLSGGLHDRRETLQAFADRAIDIALGKRFGRRGEHGHFLDPGGEGIFKTAQVGSKCAIDHTRFALDLRENLGGAGHLRHPLGRHETADFYIAEPGCGQCIDQLHLVGNTDGLGFVLQAVARADFDNAYVGGEGHGLRPVLIVRRNL